MGEKKKIIALDEHMEVLIQPYENALKQAPGLFLHLSMLQKCNVCLVELKVYLVLE